MSDKLSERMEFDARAFSAGQTEVSQEGSMDAADPAGSSHRARSASEAEPALRCEASARGVRRHITICEPASGLP